MGTIMQHHVTTRTGQSGDTGADSNYREAVSFLIRAENSMTKLNLNDSSALARAGGKYEGNAEDQMSGAKSHASQMEGMTRGFAGQAGNKHQSVSAQHLVNHSEIAKRIVEHAVASVRANKRVIDHDETSSHTQQASFSQAEATGASVRSINFGGA